MPHPLEAHPSYHAWLRSLPDYEGQIAVDAFFPPRGGARGVPPEAFGAVLAGLDRVPWRHQAEALAHTAAGRHVMVATPTASGKSLTYQVPTVAALRDGGTALHVFPTKALGHDQVQKLAAIAGTFGIEGILTYDGDTPRDRRADVRAAARGLVTNLDMLHYGILPFHDRWADFLSRLQVVAIDELHVYRGVFGVHAANVLRRLLRVARAHGATPRVVAASATIGNPAEHFANLFGEPAAVVDDAASPRGAREFLFWQPPELERGAGRRRSPNTEAATLAATFVRHDLQGLVFCNSRTGAELVYRYAAAKLGAAAERLATYRGGYTAAERRSIEASFRDGTTRVLVATNALELGVDVGEVDAVVMVGYPGSRMATWQRAGRAGRGDRRSLAILIPGADPLDAYCLAHPEHVTEGRIEDAVADPFNRDLHPRHVDCAAAERPVRADEAVVAPWLDLAARPRLVAQRAAVGAAGTEPARRPDAEGAGAGGGEVGDPARAEAAAVRFAYAGRYPHRHVRLRGGSGGRIRLVDGHGATIGHSDLASALRDLHPGAVYLQQGETYLVADLDLDAGVAQLLPHLGEWYTQARSETHVEVLGAEAGGGTGGGTGGAARGPEFRDGVHVGDVRVSTTVHGYVRKRYRTEVVLEERDLALPSLAYTTQAMWLPVEPVAASVASPMLGEAMHALEHTLIGLLPAFVLCERADVGGVSYPSYPGVGRPVIFVYDGAPGGVGYARAGAQRLDAWLGAAVERLATCPCAGGCPRCVLSPKCGNGNQFLDKEAAGLLGAALQQHLAARRTAAVGVA